MKKTLALSVIFASLTLLPGCQTLLDLQADYRANIQTKAEENARAHAQKLNWKAVQGVACSPTKNLDTFRHI